MCWWPSKLGYILTIWTPKKLQRLANPEDHLPNNRFNDGKCDPQGRFWAGTMSMLEESGVSKEPKAGSLYCLDSNFKLTKKIEGVTISNGMAWSSSHDKMFYIDTPDHAVRIYDFDASTGDISNEKFAFKTVVKNPDGMTIDADNKLWVAHWGGSCVIRYDPETGVELLRVKLPCSQVSCPVFGGEDLKTLYITTASVRVAEKEHEAGNLFCCYNLGIQGVPTFPFRSL